MTKGLAWSGGYHLLCLTLMIMQGKAKSVASMHDPMGGWNRYGDHDCRKPVPAFCRKEAAGRANPRAFSRGDA